MPTALNRGRTILFLERQLLSKLVRAAFFQIQFYASWAPFLFFICIPPANDDTAISSRHHSLGLTEIGS
jgi:hypothetical protein